MGDDYFGFLGWIRNTQRLTLADRDAAAEAVGLTPAETLPEYMAPGRRYEVGVDGSFVINVNEERNFSQFGVTGVTVSHCLHRGPDTFATLVRSIALRCDAILVRSFFLQLAYMVREEELGVGSTISTGISIGARLLWPGGAWSDCGRDHSIAWRPCRTAHA